MAYWGGGLLAHNASATSTISWDTEAAVHDALTPYQKLAALQQLYASVNEQLPDESTLYRLQYADKQLLYTTCVSNDGRSLEYYTDRLPCTIPLYQYKVEVFTRTGVMEWPDDINKAVFPHEQSEFHKYYDEMTDYDMEEYLIFRPDLSADPAVVTAQNVIASLSGTVKKDEIDANVKGWHDSLIDKGIITCEEIPGRFPWEDPTTQCSDPPSGDQYTTFYDTYGYTEDILKTFASTPEATTLSATDVARADEPVISDQEIAQSYADLYFAAKALNPNFAVDLSNVPLIAQPTDPDTPSKEPNTPGDSTTDSSDQTSASSTPNTPGTGTADQARDSSAVSFTFLAGFTAFSLGALILHRKHSKTRKIQQRLH